MIVSSHPSIAALPPIECWTQPESESAPSPVLRHTTCYSLRRLAGHLLREQASRIIGAAAASTCKRRSGSKLSAAVIAVLTVLAPQTASSVPLLILSVTCLASTDLVTIRVEACFLIQRDGNIGMVGTEDMATVATVMLANEEIERRATLRRITSG